MQLTIRIELFVYLCSLLNYAKIATAPTLTTCFASLKLRESEVAVALAPCRRQAFGGRWVAQATLRRRYANTVGEAKQR